MHYDESIDKVFLFSQTPTPPQYILWHHNGELLNFLRDRPDIHISDDLHKIRTQQQNHGFQFSPGNGVDSGFTEEMQGM